MTLRTSFCNSTLLRKSITRYWPLWALFTACLMLFVFTPLREMNAQYYTYSSSTYLTDADEIVAYCVNVSTLLSLPYAAICAACCFGYLHKSRSAYMLHAFPVSRGLLFRTNLLSGLLFFLVPWTVVMAICAALFCTRGLLVSAILAGWGMGILNFLFLYGLAIACMHITGRTVYGVLSYLALNFAAIIIEMLCLIIIEPLAYGIQFDNIALTWLSPVVEIFLLSTSESAHFQGLLWGYSAIIALVGVGLMVLSGLLYRRRQMERCGETIVYAFARPIFKYLFTLLSALILGVVSLGIIYGDIYVSNSILPVLMYLSLGAFVGYFAAEMMLHRTARVFHWRAWIGCLGSVIVLTLGLCAVRFDWFHVVRFVPETADIAYVEISDASSSYAAHLTLREPEEIDRLRTLHADWVADYLNGLDDVNYNGNVQFMAITYHLKNGTEVERHYTFWENGSDCCRRALALMRDTALTERFYRELNLAERDSVIIESWYQEDKYGDTHLALTTSQAQALNDCLIRDAAAGRIYAFSNLENDSLVGIRYYDTFADQSVATRYYLSIPSSAIETVAYLESLLDEAK